MATVTAQNQKMLKWNKPENKFEQKQFFCETDIFQCRSCCLFSGDTNDSKIRDTKIYFKIFVSVEKRFKRDSVNALINWITLHTFVS